MRLRWMFHLLTASLACPSSIATAAPRAKIPVVWQTYRSPDYGFTIAYPASMSFYPGHPVEAPEFSMFPICDDTTVACFQYNGDAIKQTKVQAAGVSVNVLRGRKSEQECNNIDIGSGPPVKTIALHGTLFRYGNTGEGGLGSGRAMTEYRTFYQHVCFEVALVVAESNMGPEDEKDEGYHPVNPRAWRRIMSDMDRMLRSFILVGPVKDGPDWNVYYDQGCGGVYEYPSSSTMQKLVEYSEATGDTSRITCVQSFTYKDREYSVAVKVNLNSESAVNQWLSSAGYPTLDRMEIVNKDDQSMEYGDQTHAYIHFRNELFILEVSATDQRPISSQEDPVLTHLLQSFHVK
jgi:hypothetical protein